MQRHENESFAAYQARRANSNAAVKRINHRAKSGGTTGSRETARRERDNSKHAGAFGRSLMSSWASKRVTAYRLKKHADYLARMEARRAQRSA